MKSNRTRRIIPEFQNALPFRRQEGVMAYASTLERRALLVLGIFLVLLTVLYIYFVVASIAHVAAREELLSTVSAEKAKVATLETEYFAKTDGITESYARAHGFVNPPRSVFVERNTALTLHNAP